MNYYPFPCYHKPESEIKKPASCSNTNKDEYKFLNNVDSFRPLKSILCSDEKTIIILLPFGIICCGVIFLLDFAKIPFNFHHYRKPEFHTSFKKLQDENTQTHKEAGYYNDFSWYTGVNAELFL